MRAVDAEHTQEVILPPKKGQNDKHEKMAFQSAQYENTHSLSHSHYTLFPALQTNAVAERE